MGDFTKNRLLGVFPLGKWLRRLVSEIGKVGGTTAIAAHRNDLTNCLRIEVCLPNLKLFMLVSALMGLDRMKKVYAHAIESGYRFYSYGDASLLLPERGEA